MGDLARALRIEGGLSAHTAVTLKNALAEQYNVKMDDAADVSGSGTTQTVGFQIQDFKNQNLAEQLAIQFGVFVDQYKSDYATVPGVAGNLGTAVEGSFLQGEGTAAPVVLTDSNGRFSCTLTKTSAGFPVTLWVGCLPLGGPIIDCREVDSVTFSA